MQKLSNGEDHTLGNNRKLAVIAFGEDSAAVKFLDDKIAVQGADEEIVMSEQQFIGFLKQIHLRGLEAKTVSNMEH
jgi:hypothetical protein